MIPATISLAMLPFGLPEPLPACEQDWELAWAPYDDSTYRLVLDQITPEETVFEIGAGDFRLAERIAKLCRKIYAIEIRPDLVKLGRQANTNSGLSNLEIIQGDARELSFPDGIDTGVLLMRHCLNFRLYSGKLREAGAKKLITNARWRMGVETIHLRANALNYDDFETGWYACSCGSCGFKVGPCYPIDSESLDDCIEIANCPNCSDVKGNGR